MIQPKIPQNFPTASQARKQIAESRQTQAPEDIEAACFQITKAIGNHEFEVVIEPPLSQLAQKSLIAHGYACTDLRRGNGDAATRVSWAQRPRQHPTVADLHDLPAPSHHHYGFGTPPESMISEEQP